MVINIQNQMKYNRLPPQNILAEEVLLGHLLVNEMTAYNIIAIVKSDFFSLEKHQILYINIINIYNQYNHINITNLIYLLWNKKLLNKIGGLNQITQLIQKSQVLLSYSEKNRLVQEYIQIIYQHYTKRIFIQYSYNILQLSYINRISIQQLHNKSTQYLQEIGKLIELQKNNTLKHLISHFLSNFHTTIDNFNKHIFSGFKALDEITNGFKDGDLIVIAGRPSMGKTSFVINITNHIIMKLNLGVYIFSLEMSKNQILDKIISIASKITINNISNKKIIAHEWQNLHNTCRLLMQSNLQIDDEGNASINYIKSKTKLINYITKKKTTIIIDYLQLIKINTLKIESRTQELGYITRELKLLAKNLKTPVIVLSQLNRSIENRINKRPLLSDLRESGCISYTNLPNIRKIKNKITNHYIETLNSFKNFYSTYNSGPMTLKRSKPQYTYWITCINAININITHNHKILTEEDWKKEDQVKKYNLHSTKILRYIGEGIQSILELNPLYQIKLLGKTNVYDIEIYEHCNFLTETQILHNSIEQDADLVLMLYQEEENRKNKIVDIIISKHRNGPVGSFQLLFHKNTCKFSNIQNDELII
uniref:DNA 5'-3' helicase n=1 Tax=Lithothamnion sp. TaxID=1940749 RepID=A0A3G3MG44_9FLOR|nr:replication helicase subunit [Lithothamnion sp.]